MPTVPRGLPATAWAVLGILSFDRELSGYGVKLRLWLGHLSSPARLREVVQQHRDQLEQVLADLARDEGKAEQVPDWSYPVVVLRWGERHYRNELAQIDELMSELDRLEAEGGPWVST